MTMNRTTVLWYCESYVARVGTVAGLIFCVFQ